MNHSIVLFDGVCNVCNASVQFILKRDPKGYFHFASIQSDAAKELLAKYAAADKLLLETAKNLDSIILIDKGRVFTRSGAALQILRHLSGLWPVLYAFIIVPGLLRNAFYDFIARNRYRWFGKKEECMIPLPEWKARFL